MTSPSCETKNPFLSLLSATTSKTANYPGSGSIHIAYAWNFIDRVWKTTRFSSTVSATHHVPLAEVVKVNSNNAHVASLLHREYVASGVCCSKRSRAYVAVKDLVRKDRNRNRNSEIFSILHFAFGILQVASRISHFAFRISQFNYSL